MKKVSQFIRKYFFFLVFLYSFVFMAVSRELIIPNMNWNSKLGNLAGDPQLYYAVALKKSNQMHEKGIGAFEIRPDSSGPAGIASLLLYIFNSIYAVVALNAFLHTLSVYFVFRILKSWFTEGVALGGSLAVMLSPYFMIWFSQINKDSYMMLASYIFLIYLLNTFKAIKNPQESRWGPVILNTLIGAASVLIFTLIRPYVNQINSLILIVFLIVQSLIYKSIPKKTVFSIAFLFCFAMLFSKGATSDKTLDSFAQLSVNDLSYSKAEKFEKANDPVSEQCLYNVSREIWKEQFLPSFFDAKLHSMIGQRCLVFRVLESQVDDVTMHSMLDRDYIPQSTKEALIYLPKAALNGIFSPFPHKWFFNFQNKFSIFYFLVPIETIIFYFGLLLALFYIFVLRKWSMLIVILPSFFFMFIFAIATPHIGVLYRYRYSWWILLLSLTLAMLLDSVIYRDFRKKVMTFFKSCFEK